MQYVNSQNNNKLLIFFKYLGFFALFFILNKAGINYLIYPFVFGTYFASIWCNQNVFSISAILLLSGYLATFSLYNLLENAIFVLIFLIIYGIHYKIKKPFKYLHIIIYAAIVNLPKLFIEIYFLNSNIYLLFLEFVLGLLYTFAVLKYFESICVRGLCGRLTSLETICAFIFVASVFCGLNAFSIGNIHLIKFCASALVLFLGYVSNVQTTLLLAAAAGVGSLFYSNSPIYLCVILIYSLCVCMFKTKNKYIMSVALIAGECICGFYFNLFFEYNILSLIPLIVAILCFIIFPNKQLDIYSVNFHESLSSLTQASVINRNRELLHRRLVELSDVFAEMNKVLRGMISGGIANSGAKRLLYNEVKIKTCDDCPNKNKCFRVYSAETMQSLEHMIDIGFEKGKINLLDVPTLFAGKCDKLNSLVSTINDLIEQYKNYAGLVNNIDASKVLLAEQLYGVSNIMRDLSLEVNSGVNFEKGKEKKIIDELTYNNIICSDALVFESAGTLSVTLAVRKEDRLKTSVSKVVSKVCGHKMDIAEETSSTRAGWQVLTLKSAPKYDCVFGVATKTKTGSSVSGDAYSIVKINDGKYLFALCDGMGSGQKAEQTSSTAIGLLENFYKAGFDREIILSSVNKLLSLGKDEVFSALDLCLLDVREGLCDFIKMGAPESYVKQKETTKIIQIGALPLGIVQNAENKAKQVYLSSGDKIIMLTDGISDAFKKPEDLQDYINNLAISNPQEMAEEILNKVLSINKKIAKDDMSIIVAKVFER
ncbi:MAG: hypothetical protein E7376_04380 [Clostridiales bacterium]|nr:hypothetical protein [Clostridiales bacterium]